METELRIEIMASFPLKLWQIWRQSLAAGLEFKPQSLARLPGEPLERICFACGGFSPVSPGIHDATNARRLSDTD
jgi:hypothetical protein